MTTATDPTNPASLRNDQRELREQLARLRRRLQFQLGLELVVDASSVVVATAAALVLLDWWFRLGLSTRLGLLTIVLAGLVAFVAVRAVRKWRAGRLDDLGLAMILDRHRPGTGQKVADVLQLPGLLDEPSAAASPAMVRLAVQQATEALAGSDWRGLWNRRRTLVCAGLGILIWLVPVVFGTVAPRATRLSVHRWLLGSTERWPQQNYLSVVGLRPDGKLQIPRDERYVMEVRSDLPLVENRDGSWLLGGRDHPLPLSQKPGTPQAPASVTVRERTGEGKVRDSVMVATASNTFRHEFPPASTSSTFELTGGDDWMGSIPVERVDRPSLAGLKLRVKEPGTADPSFREVEDPRQHLLFFPDTELELTLIGSEPLSEAKLSAHPGASPALSRLDESSFVARWTLKDSTTLEVLLSSNKTGLASKPAFFSIGLLKDREPRVTVRAQGVGSRVTPVATIPLSVASTDDIGLAALRLKIDRTAQAVSTDDKPEARTKTEIVALPLPLSKDRPVLDHQARHDLVLQVDQPPVGTILRIVGEADDKNVRGPQTGRSGAIQLQVVSLDELFYEILIRQRAERAKFLVVLETIEKQTPILASQASADDLTRVLRAEQAGARQLDQIAARITDTLLEMKLNQVGTAKSHRLLQEAVIDPIKALTAGPMNQLRAALQSLSSTATASVESREGARKLQSDVVAKMKAILDQMSQWESFVDVVNQVAEVIKMQQKVLKATESARETRTREVFDDKP